MSRSVVSQYELLRIQKIRENQKELIKLNLFHSNRIHRFVKKKKNVSSCIQQKRTLRSSTKILEQNSSSSIITKIKNKPLNHLNEKKIEEFKHLDTINNSNHTATYEHTWKRVQTMSDKALLRRISVIEKAQGKYCLKKLQIFSEVLNLVGKYELACIANDALSRIK